jgi:flagellar basal-body rod protein FlgG
MDGIDLMASAMQAMKARLDVAAVNLANASSDGFRRSVARTTLGTRGLATSTVVDDRVGALRRTGRVLDLAVAGGGGFLVRDAHGAIEVASSGSFARTTRGTIADDRGRILLGEHGPVRAAEPLTVDERGVVRSDGAIVDRIRLTSGAALQSGYLITSNVDAIREMVDVMTAQRAFETAEKALGALDDTRSKASNDVARVRS